MTQLFCPRDHVFGDPFLDDFRNCVYECLHTMVGVDPTRNQYDIADYVSRGPTNRMVQASRGEGKSTIAYFYAPWRTLREFVYTDGHPCFHTMVISANATLAENATQYIQQLLSAVRRFRCLLPDDKSRWRLTGFDVQGAIPHPLQTVFARSITGRITGDRANLILADDIEIPQNSETPPMREKIRARAAEFEDLLIPESGETVLLGTPQVEDTLYNVLATWGYDIRIWPAEYPADPSKYQGRLAPSLEADLSDNPDLVGKPTDPVRFGEEQLAKRKRASRSRYALQYLLDTSLSDLEKFPLRLSDLIVTDLDPWVGPERPAWANAPNLLRKDLPEAGMHGDHFYGPIPTDLEYVPYDFKVMSIDPSGKGKDETGYSIIGTIGGNLYLLANGGYTEGYEDSVLDKLIELAADFGVQMIVAEQNYGGGMFSALLRRKIQERVDAEKKQRPLHRAPWNGATIEDVHAVGMKENRVIDTLEPVIQQHRLIVDSNVVRQDKRREGSHGETYKLFFQMTRICRVKGALLHDDRLESLSQAVKALEVRLTIQQDQWRQGRLDAAEQEMWDNYYNHTWFGQSEPAEPSWTDNIATSPRPPGGGMVVPR